MFRDRLTRVIEERGISKYQIAKETRITEATLSNYCNGKGKPSPSIVMQLANFLDVDFNWLINGTGSDDDKMILSEPKPEYLILGKTKFTSKNSSVIIAHLEKQIDEKDKLISKLTALINDKLDVIIAQTKKD
ncbi:MAG: helix-turn-helix domain-containing protein [Candidatus Azobacteroides sp.]|nr:helix-turn-helix domain-containing protein [Candidatus Azobacteroides sp.]